LTQNATTEKGLKSYRIPALFSSEVLQLDVREKIVYCGLVSCFFGVKEEVSRIKI